MNLFKELTYQSQIRVLRKLAIKTLKQFPVKLKSLDFIQHGENTTYKVTDTKNHKYLLRIHRNGYHTKKGINEELQWLDRLDKMTDLGAPVPIKTIHNSFIATELLNVGDEERHLTLMKWVEGRQVEKSVKEKHLIEIGKLTADLHTNTKNRKVIHRNYWSAEGLAGAKPFMGPMNSVVGLNHKEQQILNEARKVIFSRLAKYEKKNEDKMGLIHADLHFGNFFFKDEKVSPIDFDDCGYGFHMYDLAVTSSSLAYAIDRKDITKREFDRLNEALLNSYNSYYPLSQSDLDLIEDLKIARRFLGTQWLNLRADNPILRKRAIPYAQKTISIIKKSLFT